MNVRNLGGDEVARSTYRESSTLDGTTTTSHEADRVSRTRTFVTLTTS